MWGVKHAIGSAILPLPNSSCYMALVWFGSGGSATFNFPRNHHKSRGQRKINSAVEISEPNLHAQKLEEILDRSFDLAGSRSKFLSSKLVLEPGLHSSPSQNLVLVTLWGKQIYILLVLKWLICWMSDDRICYNKLLDRWSNAQVWCYWQHVMIQRQQTYFAVPSLRGIISSWHC